MLDIFFTLTELFFFCLLVLISINDFLYLRIEIFSLLGISLLVLIKSFLSLKNLSFALGITLLAPIIGIWNIGDSLLFFILSWHYNSLQLFILSGFAGGFLSLIWLLMGSRINDLRKFLFRFTKEVPKNIFFPFWRRSPLKNLYFFPFAMAISLSAILAEINSLQNILPDFFNFG